MCSLRCIVFVLARVALSKSTCSSTTPGPLILPIKNVTLETPAVRRGVEMSIGTPPQSFAFSINSFLNSTYVFDTDGLCGTAQTAIQCLASNGGAFQSEQSSTWRPTNAPSFHDLGINTSSDVFGTDTVHLNASTSLASFPLDIPRNKDTNWELMNNIGLGPSSTLLGALKDSGVIASRSYSVFWGLTGDDESSQMDGSLVLGGYDEAKVGGPNLTQSMTYNPNCATNLLVTVTDIQVTGGISLLGTNKGSAILYCIEPHYPLITVSDNIWQEFILYAGGTGTGGLDGNNRSYGINLFGEDFLANDVYAGDLTFIINDELEITIPNSQLVQPDVSIDSSGVTTFNGSVREVMLNDLQSTNKNDIPILGLTFLQAAYMSVNFDESTFTLSPVLPTTDEKLVGLGQRNTSGCVTQPSTNTTSSSHSATASNNSSASASKLTSGDIAGIVVGTVALISLCGLLAFCVLRHKRRRSQRDPSKVPMMANQPNRATMDKPELEANSYSTNDFSFRDSKKTYSYNANKSPPENPIELPTWATPRMEVQ